MTQFARIPARTASDRNLSAHDFRVLVAISAHANGEGQAHPSQSRISKITGINRKNIPRSIARLEAGGYLRCYRRESETGSWSNSVYEIIFGPTNSAPSDGGMREMPNGVATDLASGILHDAPVIKRDSDANLRQIAEGMLVIWRTECAGVLSVPQSLERDRVITCHARFRDSFCCDLKQWRAYVREIMASAFLRGEKEGSSWQATFDWALKPSNIRKVREGNYRGGRSQAKRTGTYDIPPLGPGGT